MSAPIDWEAQGRARKIGHIVELVERRSQEKGLDPYGQAETIARWLRGLNSAEWLRLQHAAGYLRKRPPSSETQQGVIEIFERRIDLAGEAERAEES